MLITNLNIAALSFAALATTRTRAFSHRVEIGMVSQNFPIPVPTGFRSADGKASQFGDHHMHGPEGVQTITTRWPDSSNKGPEFVMPALGG